MSKVYIVFKHEQYDGKTIDGVFVSKILADNFAAKRTIEIAPYSSERRSIWMSVEEYDLNDVNSASKRLIDEEEEVEDGGD